MYGQEPLLYSVFYFYQVLTALQSDPPQGSTRQCPALGQKDALAGFQSSASFPDIVIQHLLSTEEVIATFCVTWLTEMQTPGLYLLTFQWARTHNSRILRCVEASVGRGAGQREPDYPCREGAFDFVYCRSACVAG